MTTCGKHFLQNPFLTNYTEIYSVKIYLQVGFSRYIISPFNVSKGNLFILDQTLGGLIELESSQIYSDYLIKEEKLIKLDSNENLKFSFKILSYLNFIEDFYFLYHRFSHSGLYNLTIKSQNTTLIKPILIPDLKKLNSFCSLVSFDSAKCSVLLYSQTLNDALHTNYEKIPLQDIELSKKVKYIGFDFLVGKQLFDSIYKKYILWSIKIPADLSINGFEILSNQYGNITIDLLKCEEKKKCFDEKKIVSDSLKLVNTWTLSLNKGPNKIIVPNMYSVDEYSVLILNQNSSIISIDDQIDFFFDYATNEDFETIPLNFRFCINILIEQIFYQSIKHFVYKFRDYGKKILEIKLEKAELIHRLEILIEKCKNFGFLKNHFYLLFLQIMI